MTRKGLIRCKIKQPANHLTFSWLYIYIYIIEWTSRLETHFHQYKKCSIYFPRILKQCKTQTVSSRLCPHVAISNFYNNNHYIYIYIYIRICMRESSVFLSVWERNFSVKDVNRRATSIGDLFIVVKDCVEPASLFEEEWCTSVPHIFKPTIPRFSLWRLFYQ